MTDIEARMAEICERTEGNEHGLGPSLSYHPDEERWYLNGWLPGESVRQFTAKTIAGAIEKWLAS